MSGNGLYVGIDVAAESVSVRWLDRQGVMSEVQEYAQTKSGWQKLVKALRQTGQAPEGTRVVMEATGVYWMALAHHLHQAGFSYYPCRSLESM